jgi:hypothetical protein
MNDVRRERERERERERHGGQSALAHQAHPVKTHPLQEDQIPFCVEYGESVSYGYK